LTKPTTLTRRNAMGNVQWITAKEVLKVNAAKWPKKIGIKDLYKEYTFKEWDEGQTATPEEITSYCKGKIAGFKVPKTVAFIKRTKCRRHQPARFSIGSSERNTACGKIISSRGITRSALEGGG